MAAGAGHRQLARPTLRALARARPRPPTPRSRRCATAARPATTAWPHAWSTTATSTSDGLSIELQPLRWALRLVEGDASQSVAALCVTRVADGRWLAGRRAPWVASWAGRWALGAGGAVDLGESPADTLVRELEEEWSVAPARVRGEALLRLPHQPRDVRRARPGSPRAREAR